MTLLARPLRQYLGGSGRAGVRTILVQTFRRRLKFERLKHWEIERLEDRKMENCMKSSLWSPRHRILPANHSITSLFQRAKINGPLRLLMGQRFRLFPNASSNSQMKVSRSSWMLHCNLSIFQCFSLWAFQCLNRTAIRTMAQSQNGQGFNL